MMLAGRARLQSLPPCRTTLVTDATRTGPVARRGNVTAASRRVRSKSTSEAPEGQTPSGGATKKKKKKKKKSDAAHDLEREPAQPSSEEDGSPAPLRIPPPAASEPHDAAVLPTAQHSQDQIQQLQHSQQQWVRKISSGLHEFEAAACRWYQDMTDRFVHVDMARQDAQSGLQQACQEIQQLEAELEQKEEDMEETMAALQQAEAEWQSSEQRVHRLSTAQQMAEQQLGDARKQIKQLQGEQQRQQKQDAKEKQELFRKVEAAQAQAADLQQDLTREREEMEMMEERLSAANAAEEDMLADMRAIKEQLASAQSQLALTTTSSSAGHDNGTGRGQAQPQTPAVRGSGGSSFPMGFGCVEQQECLDQLSVAVEQLAAVLTQGSNMEHPIVQRLLQAAKEEAGVSAAGAGVGYDLGISSWDSNAASAALHSHVLTLTLRTVQQLPWPPPSPFDTCLASCPESGRTDLQAAMQQLQQAKSSTLFLVAQQQAPSHPATREAGLQLASMQADIQQRVEQKLGLDMDAAAKSFLGHQMQAMAAAATRTQLLVSGLQGSCPGLQLVSSLEDWAAPEGQRACEAPVRQLLGKVQSSRPLFLVRPGLVCPAAGGGRQVLVRQQLVELVPDPAWLEQQRQQAAEEARQKEQQEQQQVEQQRMEQQQQRQQQQAEVMEDGAAAPSSSAAEVPAVAAAPSSSTAEVPALPAAPSSSAAEVPAVAAAPSSSAAEVPAVAAAPSSSAAEVPAVAVAPSSSAAEVPAVAAAPSSSAADVIFSCAARVQILLHDVRKYWEELNELIAAIKAVWWEPVA